MSPFAQYKKCKDSKEFCFSNHKINPVDFHLEFNFPIERESVLEEGIKRFYGS